MAKKVTIYKNDGEVISTSVSNDDTALEYEKLAFEREDISCVNVRDDK